MFTLHHTSMPGEMCASYTYNNAMQHPISPIHVTSEKTTNKQVPTCLFLLKPPLLSCRNPIPLESLHSKNIVSINSKLKHHALINSK